MIIKRISRSSLGQFIMFGFVGLGNTAISYIVYSCLLFAGTHYLVASIAGFVVSVFNSFYWNNKYIFKTSRDAQRNVVGSLFKTFIAYGFTGLLMSNVLLVLLVEMLRVSTYLAPLLMLVITVPLNFFLNKYWSFKNMKKDVG